MCAAAVVHTQIIRLDKVTVPVADRLEWCTPHEREWVASLSFGQDRANYLAAHWFMRQVVSARTGIPAMDVSLTQDERGRPALAHRVAREAKLDVSLTHSGPWAGVAVGHGVRVGLDLECADIRHPDMLMNLVRAFHPIERDALNNLRGAAKSEAILRLWTLKESYAKALGVGLTIVRDGCDRVGFPDCVFDFEVSRPTLIPRDERWRFGRLQTPPGLTGSVAVTRQR